MKSLEKQLENAFSYNKIKSLFECIQPVFESTGRFEYVLDLKIPYKNILQKVINDCAKDFDKYWGYINKIVNTKSEIFYKFCKKIWKLWKDIYNGKPEYIPFRFNKAHKIKLMRGYRQAANIFCEDNKYPYSDKAITVDGIHINYGSGSIIGSYGRIGYEFENSLVGTIKNYLNTYNPITQKFYIEQVAKNFDSDSRILKALSNIDKNKKMINVIKNLLNKAIEKNQIEPKYNNNEFDGYTDLSKSPSSLVYSTGAKNTKRNFESLINAATAIINDDNFDLLKNILRESAPIISDITISLKNDNNNKNHSTFDPNDIYISIKDVEAQSSAPTFSIAEKGYDAGCERWISRVLSGKFSEQDYNKFERFFKILGLDPSKVKKAYQSINSINLQNAENIHLIDKSETRFSVVFTRLLQAMIGGYYWYVSPNQCLWITDKPINNKKYAFYIDDAYIAKPRNPDDWGKTIDIWGHIGNDTNKIKIQLRTDGKDKYPYRIFPQIKMNEVMSILDNELELNK